MTEGSQKFQLEVELARVETQQTLLQLSALYRKAFQLRPVHSDSAIDLLSHVRWECLLLADRWDRLLDSLVRRSDPGLGVMVSQLFARREELLKLLGVLCVLDHAEGPAEWPSESELGLNLYPIIFLQDWLLAGPIMPDIHGYFIEPPVSFIKATPAPGRAMELPNCRQLFWKPFSCPLGNWVEFQEFTGHKAGNVVFVACIIESNSDKQVPVRLTSRDEMSVYANGRLLLRLDSRSDGQPGSQEGILTLFEGENLLLIRSIRQTEDWSFSLGVSGLSPLEIGKLYAAH